MVDLRDTLAALSERVRALEAGQPKAGIDLADAVLAGADGPAPVAPTNEELEQLALKHAAIHNINADRAAWVSDEIEFARVVLEQFGNCESTVVELLGVEEASCCQGRRQPAPVVGEGSLSRAVGLYTDSIDEAKLVILAVADWLQRNPLDSTGLSRRWALATAKRLRRELES